MYDRLALSISSSRHSAHVQLNDANKSEEIIKTGNEEQEKNEQWKKPLPDIEQPNVEDQENDEIIDAADFEETWEYETVYEKEELVGAIDEWISRISDSARVPWSDQEATDSFPVLRSSLKLDPFHQFDWSQGGRSHTGRLV